MKEPTLINTLSYGLSQMKSDLIVEHIIKIRCPICRSVIGSTENNIVAADVLMEAARHVRECPVCGARVKLEETT